MLDYTSVWLNILVSILVILISHILVTVIKSVILLQIESILGVVVCAVYVLLHFCTIPINCPGTSKLNQVAYVFYTTYLKEKGDHTCPNHTLIL